MKFYIFSSNCKNGSYCEFLIKTKTAKPTISRSLMPIIGNFKGVFFGQAIDSLLRNRTSLDDISNPVSFGLEFFWLQIRLVNPFTQGGTGGRGIDRNVEAEHYV
uniref:Uncharacterized protein n=1 Tax=Pyxicephalus adspersus TaxID=30357 RepID=A0AAV3B7C2_PYXAD|nr:TPA: hypothetical protein GDO54_001459 [Pyxicephalus adspersus]